MARKSYNSDSARELAQSYKITLSKIPSTRSDLKITIKNVKDYVKASGLTKSKKSDPIKKTENKIFPNKTKPKKFQQKGFHVKLVIEPRGAEVIDLIRRQQVS